MQEKELADDFRTQQLLDFMDPKRERVFGWSFFFPSFYSAARVKESKTGHLKNAEERPETIESSQVPHRLAIEQFFEQEFERAHAQRC